MDATLEALVARAVEQRSEAIEQLVYAELERRVGALVDERLNGHVLEAEATASGAQLPPAATNGSETTPAAAERTEAQRRCRGCNRDLPSADFSPGHYRCRECRRREWHEREQRRRAAAADEEPHPARPDPQTGRRGAHRLASDHYWRERRRGMLETARRNGVTHEVIGGRTFTVLHLPSQSSLPSWP